MLANIQEENKLEEIEIRIGGKVVQQDWTKEMDQVDYRMHIFKAFIRSQCAYEIRKQEKTFNFNLDQRSLLEDEIRKCEMPSDSKAHEQLLNQFKLDEDPQNFPIKRRMLIKQTQCCFKNYIKRYFDIDHATQSIVYYEQLTDKNQKAQQISGNVSQQLSQSRNMTAPQLKLRRVYGKRKNQITVFPQSTQGETTSQCISMLVQGSRLQ